MRRNYRLVYLFFLSLSTFACNNPAVNNNEIQTATVNQNGGKTALIKTTADEISEAFAKDKNRFAEICTGKPIVLTGAFGSIDDNKKDESLVIVKSAATGATVKVIFKNFKTDRIYEIEENQKVIVQGKCETATDGFVVKGTNIFLAREDVQNPNEDQNAENTNQQSLKTKRRP